MLRHIRGFLLEKVCPVASHVKGEARRKVNLPGQVVQEIIRHLDFLLTCMHAQLCPTLCGCMDCGLPGSSVHRIFQEGIMGCYFLLGDLPNPGIQTHISCISCNAGNFFTTEPPGKPTVSSTSSIKNSC